VGAQYETVTTTSVNVPQPLETAARTTTATTIPARGSATIPITVAAQSLERIVSSASRVLPTVSLSHPRLSDLTGYLELLDTTGAVVRSVRLFSGLTGTQLVATSFDDLASTAIGAAGSGNRTGSYRPEESLSAFNGLTMAGTWQLRIVDGGTGATTGSVSSWSITQPTRSTLTVGPDFSIVDLDLALSITHPNVPDLEAYLIAPDGTRVQLFAGVGNTGTRANFDGTIFDDESTTPIANGGPPFRGRYRPAQALSTLDGKTSKGQYVLEVINRGTSAGDLTGWSVDMQRAVYNTGLGEAVADRFSASFRLFSTSTTGSLSSTSWTAVGATSMTGTGLGNTANNHAGRMSAIAVDPSDPSGNTVFAGAASGGVWKTTNFLTTDAAGPTWLPLTDFGPTSGLNIGALTVFPVNNDPSRSVIFAVTGEAGAAGVNQSVSNTSRGVGILRSTDGGATWTLLNSRDNTQPFASRERTFLGAYGYEITTDPKIGPSGVIVYAALGGTNAGIWRSLDTGETWEQVLAGGNATDVVLDPSSGAFDAISNPNGNLQIVYGAIAGQGVYRNVNQGRAGSWVLMSGGQGRPLVRDADTAGAPALTVANLGVNPNTGGSNRIALAKPALVVGRPGDTTAVDQRNLFYQNWLYAAVSTGSTVSLYMTKDAGQNWTEVQLPDVVRNGRPPIPSNGGASATAEANLSTLNGYALTLEVDPTNPNVVYLGSDRNPTLIRIDVTALNDPHAYYLSNSLADGGTLTRATGGPVALKQADTYDSFQSLFNPFNPGYDPREVATLNLSRNPADPTNPLVSDTTFVTGVDYTRGFSNSGEGATWTTFGQDALAGPNGTLLLGVGEAQQALVVMRDPMTGKARLLVGYDQGIATLVDDGDGDLLDLSGGTTVVSGVRNGNLQTTQFYYGAVQPSARNLAGNVYSTMFLGGTHDNGMVQSPGDVFEAGNINDWATVTPNLESRSGDAGAVWTDQQGNGNLYRYVWGSAPIGNQTEFFTVNGAARTNGLINTNDPVGSWSGGSGNNLMVNPLNGDQILISSFSGRLYRTQDQGRNWFDISPVVGSQPTPFDGSLLRGIAYGAPDPTITGNATDDFIYVGSNNGRIWVTVNGGGTWREISTGLSGGAVRAIITNPSRGSHEAYAVTARGVFHIADSLATGASWENVSGNLFSLTHDIFGNPDQNELILPEGTSLKSLAVDWRYVIPDSGDPDEATTDHSLTHPILYVSGEGGVYRSTDDGTTWSRFPATESDSLRTTLMPPGVGGGLPITDVTDLDMSLGKIDPTTGRAVAASGDLNILLASTYGRGQYAIRLAPQVFTNTLRLVVSSEGDEDRGVTNDNTPAVRGISQQTAFGSTVYMTLYDMTDPANPRYIGGYNASDASTHVAANQTNAVGLFSVSVTAALADGVYVLGVQATDQAGLQGNIALISADIDTQIAVPPAADLQAISDSGWERDDNYTSITLVGSRSFDVVLGTGVTETYPDELRLRLLRRPEAGSVYTVVGTRTGAGTIADTEVLPDGVYVYVVEQLDVAGNVSTPSPELRVTYDSTTPTTPTGPSLLPADDSFPTGDNITNVAQPRLIGTAEVNSYIELLNSTGNTLSAEFAAGGSYTIRPGSPLSDGVNALRVRSTDRAGNESSVSGTLNLQVITRAPAVPTILLDPASDTGVVGDNVTSVTRPVLAGVAVPNSRVVLVKLKNPSNINQGWDELGETRSRSDGAYSFQVPSNLSGNPAQVYAFHAVVIDVANNQTWSLPLRVTIDTTTPGAGPTLALFPGNSTEPSDDTGIVGRTTPGATVELLRTDLATPQRVGLTTADVAGNFVVQLAADLVNGSITLQARVQNAAGAVGTLGSALRVKITSADFDFDNDGKADPTTYRAATGDWSIVNSSNGTVQTRTLGGVAGYVPLTGDFNGDGRADATIFRPGTSLATWLIQTSTSQAAQTVQWGLTGDVPLTGDYDGDGLTDLAVWRANAYPGYSAAWYVLPRSGAVTINGTTWGLPGDIPVAADFDGDGRTDLAVFRQTTSPNKGVWYVKYSTGGMLHDDGPFAGWFGLAGDVPTPGDFLKTDSSNLSTWTQAPDGKADFAVYRPSNQTWYVRPTLINASTPVLTVRIPGSQAGDLPAQADYDGDGKTDFAVYRPSTGQYLILQANGTVRTVQPGVGGDIAVLGPLSHRMPSTGVVRTAAVTSSLSTMSASIPVTVGTSATSAMSSASISATSATSSASTPATASTAGLNFGKTASRLAVARQKKLAQQAEARQALAARQAALGGVSATRAASVLRRIGSLKG
jgi:subtilisin-like proprotein convertase family protein